MNTLAISLFHLAFAALAIPTAAASFYLLILTLLSARLPVPRRSSQSLRFDVIVPARNEALVIERCLASLRALDWPSDRVRLLVIADNCDDATASLARSVGAEVLERNDEASGRKGYALRHGFEHSRKAAFADAVVVVDADAEVSRNLLQAFASRLESGAGAVQAHYGVLNPEDSWRTGLIAIAHGAFHNVRSRARERLNLSCGLRGNGWCVTHAVLSEVPYRAFSLTEDLEYGIALGLAGHRVHYAGEASADAEMASAEEIARSQRQRWADGRDDIIRSQALPLLMTGLRRRSRICLDLAADLLVPPLAKLALRVMAVIALAAAASAWQPSLAIWLWPGMLSTICLTLYVLRGWQLSGRGLAGLADLMRAPVFMLWKLRLLVSFHDRRRWTPTRRAERIRPGSLPETTATVRRQDP